jgi:glycine/D-amino acid oxidase-like deaminating enzyme
LKIIVVGGGIMGLSAARSLSQGGHAVTLLERGPLPNPLASSIDHHRLIRFMYGAEHGYAAMVAEAFPAWERLWRDLGRIHYAPTGQFLSGPVDDPWIDGSRRSMAALGIAYAELDRAAIRRRFPLIDAGQVDYALYSPTAGALFADAIAEDLTQWLADAGVDLRPATEVVAIEPETATVSLASGEKLRGDRLVVTAGVWTSRLVPSLARQLTPSRQAVLYVEPPDDLAAHWQGATMLTDVLQGDQQSVFYAVPPLRGLPIKFGDHCFSKGGDPDADRTATEAEIARVREAARRRLKDADSYRVHEAKTCFYTLTEDERFIAESLDKVLVLGGFSGHGYKFAPLIGERLAAVIDERLAFAEFRDWLAGTAGSG